MQPCRYCEQKSKRVSKEIPCNGLTVNNFNKLSIIWSNHFVHNVYPQRFEEKEFVFSIFFSLSEDVIVWYVVNMTLKMSKMNQPYIVYVTCTVYCT